LKYFFSEFLKEFTFVEASKSSLPSRLLDEKRSIKSLGTA